MVTIQDIWEFQLAVLRVLKRGKELTKSMNISTNAKPFMITTPESLVASILEWGFLELELALGKILSQLSRLRTSLPSVVHFIHKGSLVCTSLNNSSMVRAAIFVIRDLSMSGRHGRKGKLGTVEELPGRRSMSREGPPTPWPPKLLPLTNLVKKLELLSVFVNHSVKL
ncbi:hypothetical protein CIPAW_15G116500 [Carya illinoinensis]|uniref:Uncharacterized protein n=1 Tax=Carya illinoinensis TaxID=32201 RepID=A0A8T1NE95_CARIL|nr:hypothetical protein CIPAW_15G116500 [Carya illinoinensis]